jgi:hypothetical protein
MRFRLAAVRARLKAGAARMLEFRLGPSLLRALEQHVRESGAFTLSMANAGGPTRVVVRNFLELRNRVRGSRPLVAGAHR